MPDITDGTSYRHALLHVLADICMYRRAGSHGMRHMAL